MPSFMSLVETVLCATDLLDGWQRLIVTWFLCVWYAWFLVFFFFDVFTGVDEVDKSFRASSLWPREKFSVFIPCEGG